MPDLDHIFYCFDAPLDLYLFLLKGLSRDRPTYLPTYLCQSINIYLPTSTYLRTYVYLPTYIYLHKHTYVPMSTYYHLNTSTNP